MSAVRALRAFEDVLRGFRARLTDASGDMEEALEAGFGYLLARLRLESAALFLWNPAENRLEMEYAYIGGTLMEGEEEIPVDAAGPLRRLVEEGVPVILSRTRPWVAFLPVVADGHLAGAIRLERRLPLPTGRVLAQLPRFRSPEQDGERRLPLLEDVSDLFSETWGDLHRTEGFRKKARYFQAGNEVGAAVVETPRLMEMLESVSASIVKNLGVDRIRFYLVDPARTELRGGVGFQIPGRTLKLDGERYDLSRDTNSLVKSVFGATQEPVVVTAGGRVVYVPLLVNGQVVGTMAVDNLLSQQDIDEEQGSALRTLANQIGMAVLNARLFEDIEQQAITDGLTKLYVYRYFQQRLKEEIDRADRYSYSVALIMMDVDNFKTFNDTHGHLMGDRVLECLGQTIRANIRRIDLASRYGGDEFILLLPEITEQEAWLMAARLLNSLRESALAAPNGEEVQVRVTMGAALYAADARTPRDLVEAADKALYWAKRNNRGDITFFRNIVGKPAPSASSTSPASPAPPADLSSK